MRDYNCESYYYNVGHRSAVCIPLIQTPDGLQVLFEVRSSKLPDQPGDICFPGGMIEPGETEEEAAVRETAEELLISPDRLTLTGRLTTFYRAGLSIRPFTGRLEHYTGTFSTDECSEVFTVPLAYFLQTEPDNYPLEEKPVLRDDFPWHLIYGGKNYGWRERWENNYFWQVKGHVIWGFTAQMLYAWICTLKAEGISECSLGEQ